MPAQKGKIRQSSRERALVARYSRGNVNLQRQKYVTEAEKEVLRKELLNYNFA